MVLLVKYNNYANGTTTYFATLIHLFFCDALSNVAASKSNLPCDGPSVMYIDIQLLVIQRLRR